MTIAGDGVNAELLCQPRRWDLRFTRSFIPTFGVLSSVVDCLVTSSVECCHSSSIAYCAALAASPGSYFRVRIRCLMIRIFR